MRASEEVIRDGCNVEINPQGVKVKTMSSSVPYTPLTEVHKYVTTWDIRLAFIKYDEKSHKIITSNPNQRWITSEDHEKEIQRVVNIALKYITEEYDNFFEELSEKRLIF